MSARRRTLVSLLLFGFFAAVPIPAGAGWPIDPYSGNLRLSSGNGRQVYPRIAADGSGGAFIAWHDNRSGNYDIFIQRVSAVGANLWGSAATVACNATSDQANTALVSDGAGGVIVAWHDFRAGNWDIYAQRFNAAGLPQWTANGVAVCTATGDQTNPMICTDGAGGAIVTWTDGRGPSLDVYARRINAAGAPQWAANGVGLCIDPASQQDQNVITSDGAGGAVVAWRDNRSGVDAIYARGVNGSGVPQWTANGTEISAASQGNTGPQIVSDNAGGAIVCWQALQSGFWDITAARVSPIGAQVWGAPKPVSWAMGNQQNPVLVSDGFSGAIVAWTDFRDGILTQIYAQHISGSGTQLWIIDGIGVSSGGGVQWPGIVSDGAGGAIVSWSAGINLDIRAQRLTSGGGFAWSATDVVICAANNFQTVPTIVADGNGGAIVTWFDERFDVSVPVVFAQRIERFSELGNPEPKITSVRDVPNDQGGKVKVSWNASYLDAEPDRNVTMYRVWRSVPQGLMTASLRAARRTTLDPDEAASHPGWLLVDAVSGYAWEYVSFQEAATFPSYSLVASTTSDSVVGSNPRTVFMVEARTGFTGGMPYWFSAPDSGYSVDNLPPGTPGSFTGSYVAGSTDLHWSVNGEADFASYRLYRGVSAGFTPGPANLVATLANPSYVDPAGAPSFYKLSAVDAHGNESAFALLQPSATTDVPGAPVAFTLKLANPEPNPARVDARVEFELPASAAVAIGVYDAAGRAVRTLARGTQPAGRTALRWDLRDDAGAPVANGIYFVRLETNGRTLTRRLIAMR